MVALLANEICLLNQRLRLLDDKALYLPDESALLVSDVHLGKAETFQSLGIPIASQMNEANLDRLRQIHAQVNPQKLFILGDLFHSKKSLVPEVLRGWEAFLKEIDAEVCLIVGNHDRRLIAALPPLPMASQLNAVTLGPFLLSHEPEPQHKAVLNICGHIHPVVRLRSPTDSLRLPCFFVERDQRRLTLPSFGEFTGGHEVNLVGNSCAYVACDGEVIPFEAKMVI
ncbi:MAG: putative phosphoesterase [Phormidesmis priestleyi Ana]|uniref:Putative phosphoesterase n=1 Tax=Phormidesmis priestleyi Ana TaxID=1666911 RepID=A0A0P8BY97_9CYAN|nr:MAG: putative phosphoesterase [Phormidesmis priestleyi Ana]